MARSNGHKGQHQYQSIAGLNTITSEYDIISQPMQSATSETFDIDPDLSMFTNPNFFDLDSGEASNSPTTGQFGQNIFSDQQNTDFSNGTPSIPSWPKWHVRDTSNDETGEYTFPDITGLADLTHDTGFSPNQFTAAPSPQQRRQQTQPRFSLQGSNTSKQTSERSSVDTTSTANPQQFSQAQNNQLDADPIRFSAEEDKRRRNTAASARFRVKKKQREQAVEKTAKEMTDKVTRLEDTVAELKKENCLLKGLLTEKMGKGVDVGRAARSRDGSENSSGSDASVIERPPPKEKRQRKKVKVEQLSD